MKSKTTAKTEHKKYKKEIELMKVKHKIKPSKEELQKQLDAIVLKEEKERINKAFPEFKKLEGRYFKVKNCYSLAKKPSDYWWLYVKVVEVKKSELYLSGDKECCYFRGYSFQTDKNGLITIDRNVYATSNGLAKEITQEEFNTAWLKVSDALNDLGGYYITLNIS